MADQRPDEYFIKMAIEMAREGMQAMLGGPFGAVVVQNGTVIGRSANQVTSTNDPTAHAEVMAIREACRTLGHFRLEGCVIYSSCEPCPMCLGAIYWAHLDRLIFAARHLDAAEAGFDDEFIYRELDLPIDKRSLLTSQILPEAGARLFQEWIEKEDKVKY